MGSEETRQSTQDQLDNMSRSIEGLASRIAKLEASTEQASSDDLYLGDDIIKAEPHPVNCGSSITEEKGKSKKSVTASCSKDGMESGETGLLSGPDMLVDILRSIEELASRITSLEATTQALCKLVKGMKEPSPQFVTPNDKPYTRLVIHEDDAVNAALLDYLEDY